jgi:hypothetical protein
MQVIAALVLIAVVVLSRVAQAPPSEITAYAPRTGSVVQSVQNAAQTTTQNQPIISAPTVVPPTAVYMPTGWDWGAAGASSGVTAWVVQRDLIRACPNMACVALSNPTILEVGLLTDIVAADPTRSWVMINATRPNGTLGSGWIPLSAVRLSEDMSRIPVVAA